MNGRMNGRMNRSMNGRMDERMARRMDENMRESAQEPSLTALSASAAARSLPELLAPAGDEPSFLAALAAGADAAYVGLKHFSARAGADNFSLTELSRMVDLANSEGRKVFIAFNSLVKPGEMDSAGRLMLRLARDVKPHALILQDPGLLDIARQAGYEGELHLSTLANLTHAAALRTARDLGAARVILPRELSIDEIRAICAAAPQGLDLEIFIHGALCWCVSGRCYWSSYLGGKSGLRGRCVQPCRRVYQQKSRQARFFSCQDLSLDVMTKALLDIPHLRCWKIEGRKKGPHYVYHVVAAYRLLLDAMSGRLTTEGVSRVRKDVDELLAMALGRPRTRGNFLPQHGMSVAAPDEPGGSGLLIGKIQCAPGGRAQNPVKTPDKPSRVRTSAGGMGKDAAPGARRAFPAGRRDTGGQVSFKPRQDLLPGDMLRIGYEDESWHETLRLTRRVPKGGAFSLHLPRHKTPKAGTPVFLIDRREPELAAILKDWAGRLARSQAVQTREAAFEPALPAAARFATLPDITVLASLPQGRQTKGSRASLTGLWMSPNAVRALSRTVAPRISWWLPPVIWPDDEAQWQRAVDEALRNGSVSFVLGSPWQISMFPCAREGLHLTAGPFCNIANAAAVALLSKLGFKAAMVSPELDKDDLLALPRQSCLPLGMVLSGWWPVGIARHKLEQVKANEPFFSPMQEGFWARTYNRNVWIYPAWPLDLAEQRQTLEHAGYAFFARLEENTPPTLPPQRRSSEFNWNGSLL